LHTHATFDELALARQAQRDPDAFDALYRRYVTQVYRYCYARVNNVADAEDLTAQVFLAALEALAKFEGRGAFAAWLFGIASRKCADFYRRKYADRSTPLEVADTRADPEAADPEQVALEQSLLACVRRMLRYISPDRVEALHLRYWGGLSIHEMSVLMQRSESAVKMLISRALNDLRERCLYERPESDPAHVVP